VPRGLDAAFFSGEVTKIQNHDAVLVLDGEVHEVNPWTGIEIVRAVNRANRKLVLVNSGFNKLNRLASVVLEYGSAGKALDDLLPALKGAGGSDSARAAAEVLTAAGSVAVVIPPRLSDGELRQIKELLPLLKNVTAYPVVRRSNFQGALDMGVMPRFLPGYEATDSDAAARFAGAWNAVLPETPGMNAIEMLEGIRTGRISSLYVMGDDPAGSDRSLRPLLEKLEFLVVQDIFLTETAKLAHVVLPAASIAEKHGTLTNLERRLQQVSRAEEPHGESRPDWDILQTVAKRMGSLMHYASAEDILKEIRSLVPLYHELFTGQVWPAERSPLAGTDADLSLWSETVMKNEVITSERLLFSSGTMSTRSKELGTVTAAKVEARGADHA
jgi:predicted molibdopterin-dependent oxidoreductase YjgC